MKTGGADECRKVRDLLGLKIAQLDARMKTLKSFRKVLASHLLACELELREHGPAACCPR